MTLKKQLEAKSQELIQLDKEWQIVEKEKQRSLEEKKELEVQKMNVERRRLEVEIALERIQKEQV